MIVLQGQVIWNQWRFHQPRIWNDLINIPPALVIRDSIWIFVFSTIASPNHVSWGWQTIRFDLNRDLFLATVIRVTMVIWKKTIWNDLTFRFRKQRDSRFDLNHLIAPSCVIGKSHNVANRVIWNDLNNFETILPISGLTRVALNGWRLARADL
jgi:hypothetical protein